MLDHPYGWWSRSENTVLICGGKNWDLDISDNRCWTYSPCDRTWNHVLDLPFGMHGGVSGYGIIGGREEFWIVGGGNGTATGLVFVSVVDDVSDTNVNLEIVSIEQGVWGVEQWSESLRDPRFGHCGASLGDQIVIMGGKHEQHGIVETIEVINMTSRTFSPQTSVTTPHKRWGALCLPSKDKVMVMGGMDAMFLPHSSVDVFDPSSETWSRDTSLPWPQSGALGAVTEEGPTLFSGMGTLQFKTEVASYGHNGQWSVWETQLTSSRISGIAISVPSDIMDYC